MRIITGIARGVRLSAPANDDIRPTSDIVKEGVFSAIQFEVGGKHVLDLFGGTGQLALEALSRGAENAVIVDSSRAAVELIKQNAQKAKLFEKCRVVCSDYKDYLRGTKGKTKFDLIFLDPPYKAEAQDEILKKLREADIIADGAIIVCESDADGVPQPIDGFTQKLYRYGKIHITILRKEEAEA